MESKRRRRPGPTGGKASATTPYPRGPGEPPVRRRSKGVALVWVAVMLFVLIGFAGLGMDWGKAMWNVHQLHNAADAAALAGAQVVKVDSQDAVLRAYDLALVNHADTLAVTLRTTLQPEPFAGSQEGYDVLTGCWIRQWADYPRTQDSFVPTRLDPSAVRVVARRGSGLGADAPPLTLYWGPAFGVNALDASRHAIAWSRGSTGAGILVLAADPASLPGWNHATGLLMAGGATLDLWVEDPLAELTPPDISTMPPGSDTTGKTYYGPVKKTFETISGGDLTLNPGYYPGGIDMSGGSLVLRGGSDAVYAFGGAKAKNNGPGLVLSGGASLSANGVLIYITGDPTGKSTGTKTEYGRIDLGGSGAVAIVSRGDAVAPRAIDGAMGIALWQDRANSNYGRIIGTSVSDITGAIYCGYNAREIGGTSAQIGNQLIVGAVELHGTPDVHIAYDGRNEVEGYRSILVQ